MLRFEQPRKIAAAYGKDVCPRRLGDRQSFAQEIGRKIYATVL